MTLLLCIVVHLCDSCVVFLNESESVCNLFYCLLVSVFIIGNPIIKREWIGIQLNCGTIYLLRLNYVYIQELFLLLFSTVYISEGLEVFKLFLIFYIFLFHYSH